MKLPKRLPENCIQCGKANSGNCPYHMGEWRSPHLSNKIIRGVRKVVPVDKVFNIGYSIAPSVIVLLPTLRCNLSCEYCFQKKKNGEDQKISKENELGIDHWKSIVRKIKQLGIPIIVMGGELFLYPNILALLSFIKESDLSLTIITNGFNLAAFASDLVEMGLDRIIVSIDGPSEIHNAVRNHPDSYQNAVEGIRQVISARGVCTGPIVQVSCTLSTYTQNYLINFVETMAKLNVDLIEFNGLIFASAGQITSQAEIFEKNFSTKYTGSNLDNSEYSRVDVDLIQNELLTIRSGEHPDKISVMPPGIEHHLERYFDPNAEPFRDQFCTAIYREMWIQPDGSVVACAHLSSLVLGNILHEGLLTVWNNQDYRALRRHMQNQVDPICSRCEKLTYFSP